MSKRVFVVVEGQTEGEFVQSILAPYLRSLGIYDVKPILIRTSKNGKGGFVNYKHLENTAKGLLSCHSSDFVVTTFVDFFRMPNNVPNYVVCTAKGVKADQIECLQNAMDESINDRRFFSYIQLHEFEALLFSSNKGFEYYFAEKHYQATDIIVKAYANPEEINTSPKGAPSKRLEAINDNYDKVTEGNLIALAVGIQDILDRCPRFSGWVEHIIKSCN